jgi:hypothetical protein
MSQLDPAALHPRLHPTDARPHYFAAAARLRAAAAGSLVEALGASAFTPYLLHNTTSGVVTVLLAAARSGRVVVTRGPAEQHYPAYQRLLPPDRLGADWEFRTHVSPMTGVVDSLAGEGVQIVDAAQSLGTLLTPALLQAADIVIAPLHKHLGLVVGLGIVLVRRDHHELSTVHELLRVTESGAQALGLLRELDQALAEAGGAVFNRAEIILDHELRAWCAERGLRLLGSGRGVPFACVTSADGSPLVKRFHLDGWRYFAEANVARFSLHRPGRAGESPVDCTAEFRVAIGRL